MTNAELAALEARMIAFPASLALEASAGADNAEGEEPDKMRMVRRRRRYGDD